MKHSHPGSLKRAANDSLPCQTHTCTKTHTLVTKGMISAGGKKKSEAQTVHYGSFSRAPTPIPWPHNQCPVDGSQSTGASPNLMDATNSFTENHSIMRQRINVLLILPFNSNKRRGLSDAQISAFRLFCFIWSNFRDLAEFTEVKGTRARYSMQ